MKFLTTKILVVTLVLSLASSVFVPTKQADALFGFDTLNAAIQGIGHSITSALSGGILGTTGTDAAASVTSAAVESAEMVIKGLPPQYGLARTALEQPVNGCELLGGNFLYSVLDNLASSVAGFGDQTKVTGTLFISQKILALNSKEACLLGVKNSYIPASTAAVQEEPLKAVQDTLADIETKMVAVKTERAQLEAQQKMSLGDIFKAIALGIAMDINQQYTAQTINELKPKLSIGSYGKVVDALAGQVYSLEYIKNNYNGDQEKQLILNSLLNSKLVPDPVAKSEYLSIANNLIEAQRNARCGAIYALSDFTQPNFYNNLAEAGSERCNAAFSFSDLDDEASSILQRSRAAAQMELTNGQGFQSTRSCADVTQQDNQIRLQGLEVARQVEVAKLARTQFENSGGDKSSPAYAELLSKETEANQQMLAVPQRVSGGIVQPCSLITDPGGFVANQLNNYVNQWIQQSTNLQQENLPLFAQLARRISGKLFGDIILNKQSPGEVFSNLGNSFLNAGLSNAAALSNIPVTYTGTQTPIRTEDVNNTNTTTQNTNAMRAFIVRADNLDSVATTLEPDQQYVLTILIDGLTQNFAANMFRDYRVVARPSGQQVASGQITPAQLEARRIQVPLPALTSSGTLEVTVNIFMHGATIPNIFSVSYQLAGQVAGQSVANSQVFRDPRVPIVPFTSAR